MATCSTCTSCSSCASCGNHGVNTGAYSVYSYPTSQFGMTYRYNSTCPNGCLYLTNTGYRCSTDASVDRIAAINSGSGCGGCGGCGGCSGGGCGGCGCNGGCPGCCA